MAREATSQHQRDVPARAGAPPAAPPSGAASTLPSASAGRTRGRATAHPDGASYYFHISVEWRLLALVMAGALLLLGIASLSLPPLPAVAMASLAIAATAASGRFTRFARAADATPFARLAINVGCVAIPLFCFGGAIADWTQATAPQPWAAAVSGLLIVSTVASLLLGSRPPLVVLSTVAICVGPAIAARSLAAGAILAVGIGLAAFLAHRQRNRDLVESDRKDTLERAQLRAESLLAEYEQTGQGWFWEIDRRGAISYVSPAIGKVIGRDSRTLIGKPFAELFVLENGGQEGERTLSFHLSARSSFQDLAVRAANAGDEERWWSISGRPIHDAFNNFVGFRGSGTDLTEKRRSEANANRLAHYDSLTDLANRFQMSQLLEKILNARSLDHRACAVMLLDLDRFKQINDTMGHPAGDALLTQVAQRLERTVDKAGRVGRLGGDEFEVILPGRLRREDLAQLARRIIENLSHAYSIDGHNAVIGVSIGIAVSPDDGVTSEALIRNADLALYAAKDGGRGRHHFYAPDLHSDAEERRQLEHDLRHALVTGGLELHYQPVVQTTTEQISGFEALLRWTHPVLGAISPAKFIPIAEETGLIAPIGEWALRTACQDLARWPESVRVAVNVSPLQFANPALPAVVTSALAAAQIDPARLELEITESVFLNDDAGTDAMFDAIKRIGVRLALDDFGTGYSSLGYLKKAPFDKIKIDQSFVRGATMEGSRNGAIIASIVSLAEALGMETTAEGVETLDELDLVRVLGCSHIQGYIYDKALTAAAATARLESGLTAIAHGPRASRAHRHTMLRKVVLDHAGERYFGTIRNISSSGAMIEGLWNVPPGTVFQIQIAHDRMVAATTRWAREDRIGVAFAVPLQLEDTGRFTAARPPQPARKPGEGILLKKAG